jgi:glycosyltransferase involved in cell wall biosynthesis
VVTVSWFHHAWARALSIAPLHKIVAIPNGIPEPASIDASGVTRIRQQLGHAEEPLLLTPGRLAPEKGLEDLLQAVRMLAYRTPRFTMALAGDGPLRPTLEQMIAALGLQGRVRLLGFRRDIPALLAAADIIVLPSHREGLSIALLEAMAMGRPIVATAIGSNLEVTQNGRCAVVVPAGRPEALAESIAELLESPNRARQIGELARSEYLRSYSLDRMLSNYHRVYLELLGDRASDACPQSARAANFDKENEFANPIPALLSPSDR